ncbi:MAG: NYN domain-containing protein [Sphingobacteriales bacterium]|nr:NYN domain-containing protein [Sphingobacteriales bacterium]
MIALTNSQQTPIVRVAIFIDYDNFSINFKEHFSPFHVTKSVWAALNELLLKYYKENFLEEYEQLKHVGTWLCVAPHDSTEGIEEKHNTFDYIDRLPGNIMKYGTRVYITSPEGKKGTREKGVDTEIVCQMLMGAFQDHYDTVVLCSDDNDYIPAVKRLQDVFGKPVIQAGFNSRSNLRAMCYGHITLEDKEDNFWLYLRNLFYILAGGGDLEMEEIVAIAKANKVPVKDKKLTWGAKLSDYTKELENKAHIYLGIELTEDIEPPKHYIGIDHHNERVHKRSALEQVAKYLGITLDRRQQLIAANDMGYIPAMKKLNATVEEIADIRRADRAAQGISEADERAAEKAIATHLSISPNGMAIIRALSNKFAPITDALYEQYSELLIHTADELTYYGKRAAELAKVYAHLIKQRQAYVGSGYFGIARGVFAEADLLRIVEHIAAG